MDRMHHVAIAVQDGKAIEWYQPDSTSKLRKDESWALLQFENMPFGASQ